MTPPAAPAPATTTSAASMDHAALQRFRTKSDGVSTRTYVDQQECEQSCGMFFFPLELLPPDQQMQLQDHGFASATLEPKLMRDKHAEYLQRALSHLSSGFVSLDASRPWIIYWLLHGLELLDKLPSDEYLTRTVETIRHFWNLEQGGFGGGVMQLGHTATTYASCLTLALIGTDAALDAVDRQQLYKFFMRRKHHATGAFSAHDGGEVDVRVTYCVICIASLFGLLTDELTKGVVDFVVSCQTYEGGFAGEPFNEAHGGYAFCAVATLWLLDAVDQMEDVEGFARWITNRQMPFEGGYQGRTNKLVDGCYSFWQGALPALLEDVLADKYAQEGDDTQSPLWSLYQGNREQLQKYILLCGQQIEGGLRDKPGKPRDHYHSCYCLSGLSVAQHGLPASLRRRAASGEDDSKPVVFGDASNLLVATHPAYNIGVDKALHAIAYFKAKGPFVPAA